MPKKTPAPAKTAKKAPSKTKTGPATKKPAKKAPATSKTSKVATKSYLPEVDGVRGRARKPKIEDISVSVPVPRTGPPEPTTNLERLLNIKWSRYIPHEPTKKQLAAMMLAHIKEVLFGGALGGGKSDWLAMEALRYCDLPGFSAIIFRRQLTDLKQPGSLIPRIAEWLAPHAKEGLCKYSGDEHAWSFKTFYPHTDIPGPDARLQFGYIGEASVRERYQSAEFHLVNFDELGQWPEDTDYVFMRSRIRKTVCLIHGKHSNGEPNYVPGCRYCDTFSAIPLRIRAATNPGPAWIKRRFGIIPDPQQFKSRHEALIAISEGFKVRWVGTNLERPFIPSYLDDNPHLDAKDYREMLKEMSAEERSRLEDGNWEARRNARFKRRWQRFYHLNVPELLLNQYPCDEDDFLIDVPFDINEHTYSYVDIDKNGNTVVSDPIPLRSLLKVFTTIDPAVTTRQGPVDDQLKMKNSYAAISTWGVTGENSLLYLNARKFRKEIPDLVEHIAQVNELWQPRYNKIECNGVGIGVAQYCEAAGMPVIKNYRKSDKLENSMAAQIMMKHGRYFFPLNATWLETIEDDIFSWTGLPTEEDDIIDTVSDAATEVAMGVAREISGTTALRSAPTGVSTVSYGSNIPHYGLNQINRYQ